MCWGAGAGCLGVWERREGWGLRTDCGWMRTRRVTSGSVLEHGSVTPGGRPTVYNPMFLGFLFFGTLVGRGVDRGSQPRTGKLPMQRPWTCVSNSVSATFPVRRPLLEALQCRPLSALNSGCTRTGPLDPCIVPESLGDIQKLSTSAPLSPRYGW